MEGGEESGSPGGHPSTQGSAGGAIRPGRGRWNDEGNPPAFSWGCVPLKFWPPTVFTNTDRTNSFKMTIPLTSIFLNIPLIHVLKREKLIATII